MSREWEFCVQVRTNDARIYADNKVRHGISWAVQRQTPMSNGEIYHESIVASPEVFESTEEAKDDALRKLSMLRCPLDRPLDKAIKWVLDE